MTQFRLIPAQPNDRSFFIQTHHCAYRSTIEGLFGWDDDIQDRFASQAFDAGSINIIEYQGYNVGIIGFEERIDDFWLKDFFILPDSQNQGLGSLILKQKIALAKQHSKPLRLRTLINNGRAKAFYERHGLTVESVTDIHWNLILNT